MGEQMRTRYAKADEMDCILMALTEENKLACEVMLATGLRISDVLALKSEDLKKTKISIKEMKTGKRRIFTLPVKVKQDLATIAGRVYIFEHRLDQFEHRTRQAVWQDMHRVADALRLKNIAPHSARKIFAVKKYNSCGNMKKVQELLNHSDEAVTMLYALADKLSERNGNSRKRDKSGAV